MKYMFYNLFRLSNTLKLNNGFIEYLRAIHPEYIDCTFDMQTLTIHSIVIYQTHATDVWDDLHGMHPGQSPTMQLDRVTIKFIHFSIWFQLIKQPF